MQYRTLYNEIIADGDEFLSVNRWCPCTTTSIGCNSGVGGFFRRKIMQLPTREELNNSSLWRRLTTEVIREGDVLDGSYIQWAIGMIGERADTHNYKWYRRVPSLWISTSERLPTDKDGSTLGGFYPKPVVLAVCNKYITIAYVSSVSTTGNTHWMTIPEVPAPIEPPIVVGKYTAVFKDDGVQFGCTFVPKATVLKIAERLK